MRIDVDELKRAAQGREVEIVTALTTIDPAALDGKHHPCPKCGGTDRFRLLDRATGGLFCGQCHREKNSDFLSALQWANGWTFPEAIKESAAYLGIKINGNGHHQRGRERLNGHPKPRPAGKEGADGASSLADPDTRHAAYTAFLNACPLDYQHLQGLIARGMSREQVQKLRFRSLRGPGRSRIVQRLIDAGVKLDGVPGFTHQERWTFRGPKGILIPIRDEKTRIIALSIRRDEVQSGTKYCWASSKKWGGPSPGAPPHVPETTPYESELWRVTEGALKADVASCLSEVPTLGIAGVGQWKTLPDLLRNLGAQTVRVAFDADCTHNQDVAQQLRRLVDVLRTAGFAVEIERWDEADGKGIDDLLRGGKQPQVVRGEEVDQEVESICSQAGAEARKSSEKHKAAERIVTNAEEVEGGDEKPTFVPLSMQEIIDRTSEQTGDWPRRVGGILFVHDPQHGIAYMDRPPSLFGYFARTVGAVFWRSGPAYVGREEYFAEVKRTARSYVAVEDMPHEPAIEGHYYACDPIPPGDGSRLRELLDRFSPATDIDRDLILAMLATPLWGGKAGCRPAFCITSDAGRGVGKSKLGEFVAQLYRGNVDVCAGEDAPAIKTRLLSSDALTKRVLLLDNVKSHRFSWAELEALITAPAITGHRLYVGEASRPNTLTWIITLNGPSLSTDLAQRSIIVKLDRPSRSGAWEEETRFLIESHRQEIFGDIIALLRSDPYPLPRFTRWATWEAGVLSRLPEPTEAQAAIAERQAVVDVEREEGELIADHFRDRLQRLRYAPDHERIFIPTAVASQWFSEATGSKATTTSASRAMGQMVDEGRLPCVQRCPHRSLGRGWYWVGEKCGASVVTATDVRERLNW